MLLVQKEDRDTSEAVSVRLKEMLQKCKQVNQYALRNGEKETPQRRDTAKPKSDGPVMSQAQARSKQSKRKRPGFSSGYESSQGPASRIRRR